MKTSLSLVLAYVAVGALAFAPSVTPSAARNHAAVATDLTLKLNPFVISADAEDSYAPEVLPRYGLVFTGRTLGTYKVYLDNLRVRHADGTTTPIWTNVKDTRAKKNADSEWFKKVLVRSVPLSAMSVK
jgi:hypothetical protein